MPNERKRKAVSDARQRINRCSDPVPIEKVNFIIGTRSERESFIGNESCRMSVSAKLKATRVSELTVAVTRQNQAVGFL